MAHIDLGLDERRYPGILGLLRFRPETAQPLLDLASVLLHRPHSLSAGERELIAAYVSGLNGCGFCRAAHSSIAAAHLPGGMELVERVHADPDLAPVPEKLRQLLRLARAVQQGGRTVTSDLVGQARGQGATDVEIHDTVLIAAVFCMVNRYVDGLGTATVAPTSPST